MNDKYSLAKCAQYGRRLAARLCDSYFTPQPAAVLDGPALLKFTPVRQLNLLVMRQLLGQWQAETARLRSPYFSFEAVPVQAALTQFMNVLSRHIRLGRAALEPLLAQAAADTLGLVADPADGFQRHFLGVAEAFTASGLRETLRYLDVDKTFYQGFVDSVPSHGELSRDFLLHRFELYHAANYKAHQPMQRLVAELSALLPLTTADLLEDGPVSAMTTSAGASIPAPAAISVVSAPAVAPPVPRPTPIAAAPPHTPAAALVLVPAADAQEVPLHEKLKASQPPAATLSGTLRSSAAPPSLAERASPKVETLREAISINQRFSFINELFNGENMDYHAAIQHLDALPTAEQARAYVSTDLSPRYDWSRKEEHVNKLLKLIERKFA